MIEIDLHGLTVKEMLAVLQMKYNYSVKNNMERIKVIHGYGATGSGGKLKQVIHELCIINESRLSFITGEEIDGNPGYTILIPKNNIDFVHEKLIVEILDYVVNIKSIEKIYGNFRNYSYDEINRVIRRIIKSGLAEEISKNGKKHILKNKKEV